MTTAEFLLARKLGNGSGGDVTIESLNVTENGTYSEQGKAYSPVTVNVAIPPNSFVRKSLTGGAIASFSDGSDNPLANLKIGIDPIQDLHGYDKPWPAGGGKNKLPSSNATNTTLNGITFKTSGDGIYEVSGTATAGTNCEFTFSQAVSLVAGKKLSFFNNFTGYNLFFRKDGADKTYYNFSSANRTVTIAAADAVEFDTLRITVESGATINGKFALMMYEGDTTTTYEPYTNICPISGWSSVEVTVADDTTEPTTEETYEIALGQTVYGGKLNVTTGELTVDKAMVDMGTLNWTLESSVFRLATNIGAKITSNTSEVANMICSIYETVSQSAMGGSSDKCVAGLNWGYGVRVKDTSYSDASSFKSAMNGVQLVYELATPTTISLTPTQVSSLLGNNNIWADTGDIIEGQYFSALS